jgi:hypothetical protein
LQPTAPFQAQPESGRPGEVDRPKVSDFRALRQ